MPGVSKADGTNGTRPVVSVQTTGNATMSGSLSGAFTIQRTGDTSQALVVNYRLSGTATNGIDYQRLSGAVTIPAGQSAASVGVIPMSNPAEGIDKNVTLTLVSAKPALHDCGAAGQPELYPEYSMAACEIFLRRKPNGLRPTSTTRTLYLFCTKAILPTEILLRNGHSPWPAWACWMARSLMRPGQS